MAYVPDEAIDRSHEISLSAFRLYCYYCKRRDGETGTRYPSLRIVATDLKMVHSYVSEMRAQLIGKGWIRPLDDGRTALLVGFASGEQCSEKPNTCSEKPNSAPAECSEKPNNISEFPNREFGKTEHCSEKPNTSPAATPLVPPLSPSPPISPLNPPAAEENLSDVSRTAFADAQAGGEQVAAGEVPPAKASKSERKPDPLFEAFAAAYVAAYGVPYGNHRKADFVQLAALRKLLGGNPAAEDWERAIGNYFATPLGRRTLADLCARYAEFRLYPLNEYGRPAVRAPAAPVVVNGVDYGRFAQTAKTAKNAEAIREFSEEMERRIQR